MSHSVNRNGLFSAIILAAGNSVRMGRDKSMLRIGPELNFAEHLVNCFVASGCNPVVLIVNEQFDCEKLSVKNLVTVVNHDVEKGRSHSILLGIHCIPTGYACFIHNVDNPFLDPGLSVKLLDSITPDSYVVPVYRGRGGHPVLLGSKVVDFFRQQQDLPDFRGMLFQFTRIEVPFPDERILWNINTPYDYKEFISWKGFSHKKM